MNHLVLLGDSIFDNALYVPGDPAVIDQVRRMLNPLWGTASLIALDGSVTTDIEHQIKRLPPDTTHLAISTGGNDALNAIPTLQAKTASVSAALEVLSSIQTQFESNYTRAITAALAKRIPLSICTVYDHVPDLPAIHRTALSLFNDVILRTAIQYELPVLDLRYICSEAADYSARSPIEPSAVGGNKIAHAIVSSLLLVDASPIRQCRVFTH